MNPPKPSSTRKLEGMRGHRPLPANEPQYAALACDIPQGLSSTAARKYWTYYWLLLSDARVATMADQESLCELCEDKALLDDLRKGMKRIVAALAKKAKDEKRQIVGNAMAMYASSMPGRKLFSTMTTIQSQIMAREATFGLTPSSRTRIEAGFGVGPSMIPLDPLERGLCATKPKLPPREM